MTDELKWNKCEKVKASVPFTDDEGASCESEQEWQHSPNTRVGSPARGTCDALWRSRVAGLDVIYVKTHEM